MIGATILLASGCAPAINWRFGTFDQVHADTRSLNKLNFVYFRNWYQVECTDYEEKVLKSEPVLQATSDMICIPLNFDYDRPQAEKWGLSRAPSYAIIAPDGRVLVTADSKMTQANLLDSIKRAREAVSTKPAKPATTCVP